eukprot:CAMPEP_0179203402 /NCGR_PEP_ID=MMETSP0796-20121207/101392_1 /TAXON_ID=73915 /ORGANISM="Pyrodinium bahamense, Strain pbaha01" /LENGTH=580 /DNA_ID=CAMNT_0020908273 /DNA_START=158 /DNA_END=1901 /DNA_ORIENTATION=-
MGRGCPQQSASFAHRKRTFLGKGDKSSAGGIDAHAQEVCAAINERCEVFTTSSCSGRAYLWRGEGVKSTTQFLRYRVTHELIPDAEAEAYFDLGSLAGEVVDASWLRGPRRARERPPKRGRRGTRPSPPSGLGRPRSAPLPGADSGDTGGSAEIAGDSDPVVWLRFEPFILHMCCRDLPAAQGIITAARQVFKNVGVQSWAEGKVMLAVWGDEGIEMPLTGPTGQALFHKAHSAWLQAQVNDRHRRNWAKIDRFTQAVRELAPVAFEPAPHVDCRTPAGDASDGEPEDATESRVGPKGSARAGPRHFDKVGDVAILSALAPDADKAEIGREVLKANGGIKVVAARVGSLTGDTRAPGGLEIIAGHQRRPLMTTHSEFGVRVVINLETTFFSPRMGPERQRICDQVQAGEAVCVAFAGCCPEALQLVARTEASRVVAVELCADAVRCAKRSAVLLGRRSAERAARLEVLEGDACAVAAALPQGAFHRLLAPRPKGRTEDEDAALVGRFLAALVPLLGPGGVCHWYDFVADWELPACERPVRRIVDGCAAAGRPCKILRRAPANNRPVAERQYRTVIDFRVN